MIESMHGSGKGNEPSDSEPPAALAFPVAACRLDACQRHSLRKIGAISQVARLDGVEVDEDFARFRPIARAHVAAHLQDIEDAGGSRVAEPEAALEERGRGFPLLLH